MLTHKNTILSFTFIFITLLLIILVTNRTDKTNANISHESSEAYHQYNYGNKANSSQESSVKIYQLQVENNHTYYLRSIEEIESILNTIATTSTDNSITPEVNIKAESEQYEPIIEVSSQPTLSAELIDRTLTTSSLNSNENDTPDDSFKTNAIASDSTSNKLTNLSFNENITITAVSQETLPLSTVNDVVEELMKLNVEPKSYSIQPGDSASLIAEENDMKLTELYKLNPDLKDKERSLQIGEQIIVEKMIPEVSIVSCYESTDLDTIPYEVEYREDDSIYIGLEEVSQEGLEGTLLVTSDIDIMNDDIIKEEIITTKVIAEPQPQVISKGTKPVPEKGPAGFFTTPLGSYRLTSSYGPRWGRIHKGIDMGIPTGTFAKASDGGTVVYAGWDNGYGYRIDIDHGNGKVTRYAHNSKLLVEYGQVVGQGQVIAKTGNTGNSTGPHLHFELIINGEPVNPFDYIVG